MEFNPNKTPVEVIKEGAFGRTYLGEIYSGVNKNGAKIHGNNSMN